MGIILRWKNFNYMLEIDIISNYFPKDLFAKISLYYVMGIILRWKNFNYVLEIDIISNYFPKDFGAKISLYYMSWELY